MATKTKLALELDGQVNIVEYHGKKRIGVHPIDGKLILDIVREQLTKKNKTST